MPSTLQLAVHRSPLSQPPRVRRTRRIRCGRSCLQQSLHLQAGSPSRPSRELPRPLPVPSSTSAASCWTARSSIRCPSSTRETRSGERSTPISGSPASRRPSSAATSTRSSTAPTARHAFSRAPSSEASPGSKAPGRARNRPSSTAPTSSSRSYASPRASPRASTAWPWRRRGAREGCPEMSTAAGSELISFFSQEILF